MPTTCYDVLAVDADATRDEIASAFRRRARDTHPDVSDHPDATDRFRVLERSRATLLDSSERTRYDRLGHDAYAERAWSDEFATTWHAVTEEWFVDADVEGTDADDGEDTDFGNHGTVVSSDTTAAEDESAADETESSTHATGEREPSESRTDRSTTAESTRSDSESTENTAATAAGAESASVAGGSGRATGDVDDARLWDVGQSSWVDEDRDAGRGETGGFGIRNVDRTGTERRIGFSWPDETELLFAVALFIGYPFFLFGSVAPAFPLVVNVTLAVLTLILVGYALVRPAIGVGVFGAWSVVATVVVALWNVEAGSVALPAIAGACWLPFGFALLVAYEFG